VITGPVGLVELLEPVGLEAVAVVSGLDVVPGPVETGLELLGTEVVPGSCVSEVRDETGPEVRTVEPWVGALVVRLAEVALELVESVGLGEELVVPQPAATART
jgi:hypothetical protein